MPRLTVNHSLRCDKDGDTDKFCSHCGEIPPVSNFNKSGHNNHKSWFRSRCLVCESKGRKVAKGVKLKACKNSISTNGGSSKSPQLVVP